MRSDGNINILEDNREKNERQPNQRKIRDIGVSIRLASGEFTATMLKIAEVGRRIVALDSDDEG